MASEGSAKQILSQIFGRIGELSDALSRDESGDRVGSSNMEANDTVEGEVQRVFGRHRSSAASDSQHDGRTSSTAVSPPVPVQPAPAVTPSLLNKNQNTIYNARKYFGNQRSAIKNSRSRKGKDTKRNAGSFGSFSRDLILLAGPDDKDIPRQGRKVFLQENGHIISAFEFRKEWSDIEVELEIREAFLERLPASVDIEIVHSVHTALLKSTLAPGQYLTGSVINRIFRDNKPVYIMPCWQILHPPKPIKVEKRRRHHTKLDGDSDSDCTMDKPAYTLPGKNSQS